MTDQCGDDVLRRLFATEDIRQLAYRYAYSVDFRDVDMYRALWAASDTPAQYPDIDCHTAEKHIRDWPKRGPSILFVCNHLIDFDDNTRAHGTVYCLVQVAFSDTFIDQSIAYQDRYVVEDGQWRFAVRRHLLWFGEPRATNPLQQPAANWPASPFGRGTLPEDVESYRRFQTAAKGRAAAPERD